MELVKKMWLPIRRVWMDDEDSWDEVDQIDKWWLISTPIFNCLLVIMLYIVTWNN